MKKSKLPERVNKKRVKFALRHLNWMHFAIGHNICYIEFKLSYLENLKLFSIRVKELFKPQWRSQGQNEEENE